MSLHLILPALSASSLLAAPTADPHSGMVHHFDLGSWTLIMSYVVSVIGSFIGLTCSLIARTVEPHARRRWLVLAAFAIGGIGVWLMHFIAMFGWSVDNSVVRFDPLLTVASAAISICGALIALLIVGTKADPVRIIVGGLVLGAAATAMHYVGAAAMQIQGDVSYNVGMVALSAAIAVVAAIVALIFTVVLRSVVSRWIGGLIMGVAVVAMHYTGMFAMRVTVDPTRPVPNGFDGFTILFPVFVTASLLLGFPIIAILLRPSLRVAEARQAEDAAELVATPPAAEEDDAAGIDVLAVPRRSGSIGSPRSAHRRYRHR